MSETPLPKQPNTYGVCEFNARIKRFLERTRPLADLYIRGEVTAHRLYQGSVRFQLKENRDVIACVAWPDAVRRFPPLADGEQILARGYVTAYGAESRVQLIVREVLLEGIGEARRIFDDRRKRLEREGLFAEERKRPLPRYPFRVALVSSKAARGAVDFVSTLKARAPHVAVTWCETRVQGQGAEIEIAGALRKASALPVDVIVVARGGGSFEDLFWFSDEGVVRAVAGARHPVISAIGHTQDRQLCDLAADKYVSTPTAAAEAVGESFAALNEQLGGALRRLVRCAQANRKTALGELGKALLRSKLENPDRVLDPYRASAAEAGGALGDNLRELLARLGRNAAEASNRLNSAAPAHRLEAKRYRLADLTQRRRSAHAVLAGASSGRHADLKARFGRRPPSVVFARAVAELAVPSAGLRRLRAGVLQPHAARLEAAARRLNDKNPAMKLERGYAIVEYAGRIVNDAASVPIGAAIVARLANGNLQARVEARDV